MAKPRKLTKEQVAYHEAGHAVIARVLGVSVAYVTLLRITDYSRASAAIVHPGWHDRDSEIVVATNYVKICLAGPCTEFRTCPIRRRPGDSFLEHLMSRPSCAADWRMAVEFVVTIMMAPGDSLPPPDDLTTENIRLLGRLWNETIALVRQHWGAIERVAQALLQRPILNEAELDALIVDRPLLVLP
jgi:hypothetical protein